LNLKAHRLVRQLHLWIGAWGAIAAILFGISGFMQNHRGIMKLPQGDTTEISSVEMEVPESARQTREEMRAWLHDVQHIDVEIQRARGGGPSAGGRGAEGGRRGGDSGPGGGGAGPGGSGKRWMFNGGNARILTQVEYVEGASTATVRKSENSPLAILSRLHKGVGGGVPWILLTDSFAVAMVLLGISGIILWARGRTVAQMAFSIVGVAVVVLLAIGGSAIV
jgi:hypothetical protein